MDFIRSLPPAKLAPAAKAFSTTCPFKEKAIMFLVSP